MDRKAGTETVSKRRDSECAERYMVDRVREPNEIKNERTSENTYCSEKRAVTIILSARNPFKMFDSSRNQFRFWTINFYNALRRYDDKRSGGLANHYYFFSSILHTI